jgi:hypothetical protein
MMELAGREENKVKTDPERESGNKRIFEASLREASPQAEDIMVRIADSRPHLAVVRRGRLERRG